MTISMSLQEQIRRRLDAKGVVGLHPRDDRTAGFGQNAGPAGACPAASTRRDVAHVDHAQKTDDLPLSITGQVS